MSTEILSQFWQPFRVQRLGWALLHFLWQGTAIAVAFAMLQRLLARSLSAQARYVLACVALAAMAVAPALTFLLVPAEVRAILEPRLRDSNGVWVADYVRLRFAATKV